MDKPGLIQSDYRIPGAYPIDVFQWKQYQMSFLEADDFGEYVFFTVTNMYLAYLSKTDGRAVALDHQPGYPQDRTFMGKQIYVLQYRMKLLEIYKALVGRA